MGPRFIWWVVFLDVVNGGGRGISGAVFLSKAIIDNLGLVAKPARQIPNLPRKSMLKKNYSRFIIFTRELGIGLAES